MKTRTGILLCVAVGMASSLLPLGMAFFIQWSVDIASWPWTIRWLVVSMGLIFGGGGSAFTWIGIDNAKRNKP
jgi:hypothetical protein